MSGEKFIAIPALSREFLPEWVGGVEVIDPVSGGGCLKLPMSRREAEMVLREWQNRTPGELQQEIFSTVAAMNRDDGLFPNESQAISAFGGTGAAVSEADMQRRAQSLLLLALAQCQRVSEVDALNRRFAEQEARLARLLAEDDDEIAPVNLSHDAMAMLPSWKFVLNSAAWFLPEDACLVVTDARLGAELMFCGGSALSSDLQLPDGMYGQFQIIVTTFDQLLGTHLPAAIGELERRFIVRR